MDWALKVLVSTISAPASKILPVDVLDEGGWVRLRRSLRPFRSLPQFWNRWPAETGFVQLLGLDHRPHRSIQNDDALPKQSLELLRFIQFHIVPKPVVRGESPGKRAPLARTNGREPKGKKGGMQAKNQHILMRRYVRLNPKKHPGGGHGQFLRWLVVLPSDNGTAAG